MFRLTKRAAQVLPCDPALAYEILTDYDSYSEWAPFVGSSKLLAIEGDLAIAEFEARAKPGNKLVMECIHARDQMVLGRRIEGHVPISKIQWDLAPAEGGGCRVALTVESRPSWRWLVPGGRRILNAGRFMAGLRTQVSVYTPAISVSGESGETVLEVVETGEGLVAWLNGKKYLMQPAPGGKS